MSSGMHELKPPRGARRPRRRVGRGNGSGRGTYSGRGNKGQKAKGNVPAVFEGGQLPLVKRLPYMRGFTNIFRTEYVAINLGRLDSFDAGSEVTPASLLQRGIVGKTRDLVKILGDGEISKPLQVAAHAFSATARAKIEAVGGTATVIGKPAVAVSRGDTGPDKAEPAR